MKKLLAILMAFVLVTSLVACAGDVEVDPTDDPTVSIEETNATEAPTEAPTEPHEHKYSVEVIAATCDEDGYTLYTCECGDSYAEDYVEATGHDWGEWETTKEATATTEGTAQRTCANCDEVETKTLPKDDGHTCEYTSEVTKEATCSAYGTTTYTCKTCGHSYTERIAKLAHTYKNTVTEPTCSVRGYTTHTCSVCSYSYKDNYTATTAHDYTSKVTTASTCSAAGTRTYTCKACGKTYTESIEKTAHSYTSSTVAPTCTEKGYTLYSCVCGDSYKENYTEATGHSWGEWETTKKPTYFTTGTAQRKCSKCGEIETKTLPKTNHTCEYTSAVTTQATCYAEGVRTYTCTICGVSYTEAIAKTAHNYKDTVTKPTCTEAGYTTHKCSVCGDSYTDTTVAATGHSYSLTSDTATCTNDGTKTETCSICGDTKKTTSSATGHLHTTTETREATCEYTGYTKVICSDCGEVISNTTVAKTACNYTITKRLSDVAKTYVDGWGSHRYINWITHTDWNVKVCEYCGRPDLDTATYVYDNMTAANIMLGYVNDLRREVLGEGYDLVLDSTMVEYAAVRAKEISTNYNHISGNPYGENIDVVSHDGNTLSNLFSEWKASSGHYDNMTFYKYKRFGFAIYVTDYQSAVFGVQLFGF